MTERKSFVTFRNGLMQLDVKAYLASDEGKAAMQKVIRTMDAVAARHPIPVYGQVREGVEL